MITGDDRWYQVAVYLFNAVQAALTVPVPRAGIVPGDIAWDMGSDCGALYLTWTQMFYSNEFPHREEQPFGNCPPALEAMEFTLQVVRCEPTGDTSRSGVGTDVLTTAAQQLAIDGHQMASAVLKQLCAMKDAYQVEDYLMGPVTTVGPEGGLAAAELTVGVGMIR